APAVADLDRVLRVAVLDLARGERATAVLGFQALGHPGLEGARASPGLERRQVLSKLFHSGQALPALAVPSFHALRLAPALEANEGRRRFDPGKPRVIELAIVDHVRDAGGKLRIVLRHDVKG